ncbi:Xylose isomerase-like TIM barrel [uncultured Roseburia sp.]|uniref:TIM barrel protein n=1 Tax=Brotonthovivens ammoniilytica TaxID=2981725 RepID=A0ABT2TPE2_9FIRM|nr:TIM barrel protein [Brotonthovivens ammoniilytica]MCU6763646.1 TIM barrel protein [Brotonthovivens ammoniilytica]SCJ29278.1 Xylose isomerase-like TIM barrel [uncultured Roseburia sp.]
MKFGCSLEMVNVLVSGPGAFNRQSKKFWTDYIKYISAVGFQGIELPFWCFSSDAMAFETGRSGIPCNQTAIKEKYSSPEGFLEFLREAGIETVVSVHVNANDAMLELAALQGDTDTYYSLLEQLCMEGLEHACSLKAEGLIVSPSPELGWLYRYFGDDFEEFEQRTVDILQRTAKCAREKQILFACKNEFWSYFHQEKIRWLTEQAEGISFCPDLAHLKIAGVSAADILDEYRDNLKFIKFNDTAFKDLVGNAERINAELPVEGAQKVFCDCGEGDADLIKAAEQLKRNGFDGWVICENKNTLDVYKGLLKLGWFVNNRLKNV